MERENETYHLVVDRSDCGAGCFGCDLDCWMKTFKWTMICHSEDGKWRHVVLETTSKDTFRLWAVLDEVEPGLYIPVALSKKRDAYMTLEEGLGLEDARLAVEKYLMDNGVIEEGDVVVYEE